MRRAFAHLRCMAHWRGAPGRGPRVSLNLGGLPAPAPGWRQSAHGRAPDRHPAARGAGDGVAEKLGEREGGGAVGGEDLADVEEEDDAVAGLADAEDEGGV